MLRCIAPRLIRGGMRLDHKTGEVHLQPHTTNQRHEITATCDVAGINEDGQLGMATPELNRDLP